MPLPFELEGKGVVSLQDLVVHYSNNNNNNKKRKKDYNIIFEPTSVLDSINTTPSPPASTSTLSSPLGGGDTSAAVAAPKWPPPHPENQEASKMIHSHFSPPPPPPIDHNKCMEEDWETTGGGGGDSGQDQAMLRWIMGDVEDPSLPLNKMLHGGGGGGPTTDFDFNGGFGVVDQGIIGLDSGNQMFNFSQISNKLNNEKNALLLSSNPHVQQLPPPPFNHHQIFLNETQMLPFDIKPQIFNPQLLSQPQSQSQPFEHQLLMPPQPKRQTLEMPRNPFLLDSGQNPNVQKSPVSKMAQVQLNHHHGIIDQLFKAADSIQSANNNNNPILAQGILARLNHQLSPIGNAFDRAAFYFKEALQLLLHSLLNNINPQITPTASPFTLIFKIGAYKSFSEISPFLQFANFTCNQALLESLDGFQHIHIVDFDIGYGGQWASLMQELALRSNGVSSLKITAFASPSTHDQLELGLTRENLIHFAAEINVGFDFEIVNVDVLASSSWSLPFHVSDTEAVAVNLPVHVLSNHQTQIPSVLRFVRSLAPKIVVSVDRGCDRTDLPFSNHVVHALQSYSNLLDSLDAVNVNPDSLQKIERFLVQPAIEKIVLGRYLFPEKTPHWRTLFLSAGFSPLSFSNVTESQAECLVKRTPVRDFHVEKRQSLLVLCWQRRELVSASAWRC